MKSKDLFMKTSPSPNDQSTLKLTPPPPTDRSIPTTCHPCTFWRGRRGRGRLVVGITTIYIYVIGAYHHLRFEVDFRSGEEYWIHYVIKFVSDLRQIGDFLRELPISSINKTDHITEILLKVALKTMTLTITHPLSGPFIRRCDNIKQIYAINSIDIS